MIRKYLHYLNSPWIQVETNQANSSHSFCHLHMWFAPAWLWGLLSKSLNENIDHNCVTTIIDKETHRSSNRLGSYSCLACTMIQPTTKVQPNPPDNAFSKTISSATGAVNGKSLKAWWWGRGRRMTFETHHTQWLFIPLCWFWLG